MTWKVFVGTPAPTNPVRSYEPQFGRERSHGAEPNVRPGRPDGRCVAGDDGGRLVDVVPVPAPRLRAAPRTTETPFVIDLFFSRSPLHDWEQSLLSVEDRRICGRDPFTRHVFEVQDRVRDLWFQTGSRQGTS